MSIEVLTPAAILVSRAQQKIIHPALNWIRKHEGIEEWTYALDVCCAEASAYILRPSWAWPCIVIPTVGPTQSFRYLRDPDPDDFTNGAIDIAKGDIGLDDEGAALAHIASTFILTRPEIAGFSAGT
jgi:hypothetical protein